MKVVQKNVSSWEITKLIGFLGFNKIIEKEEKLNGKDRILSQNIVF